MANGQGGIIIVGVEDAEKKIVGIPDECIALTIDVIASSRGWGERESNPHGLSARRF